MESRLEAYKGCLLGLAAGDAMGYGADHRTLAQIRTEYGPEGLLEMELVNGYGQFTSYTQTAAYACNGLLVGVTQGQMRGTMAPHVRYIALALGEWAKFQSRRREQACLLTCWISREDSLFARRCMDPGMLDVLNRHDLGTMEEPKNRRDGAAALTAVIPVGMFFDPERMKRREIAYLGAETVALTHGDPMAFLAGAALAYIVSRITWDGVTDLRKLTRQTIVMLKRRFGAGYHQTAQVCQHLQTALALAVSPNIPQAEAMEQMGCTSASRVLAGAIYCCLIHPGSFDECMITAVNHSGDSCAVGAVAGALFGAMHGVRAIGEHYTERLEPARVLEELAADMLQGCPMTRDSRLFDMEWDGKYISPGTAWG